MHIKPEERASPSLIRLSIAITAMNLTAVAVLFAWAVWSGAI